VELRVVHGTSVRSAPASLSPPGSIGPARRLASSGGIPERGKRRTNDATREEDILALIETLPLEGLVRIDAALEGDWSHSITTVWTCEKGLLGFGEMRMSHAEHLPSIELMFREQWVGVRCLVRDREQNRFDETSARTSSSS
jgi:hypothetical protein